MVIIFKGLRFIATAFLLRFHELHLYSLNSLSLHDIRPLPSPLIEATTHELDDIRYRIRHSYDTSETMRRDAHCAAYQPEFVMKSSMQFFLSVISISAFSASVHFLLVSRFFYAATAAAEF